jgi:cystathionine beta-lyase/cystathionine gamma-synthase
MSGPMKFETLAIHTGQEPDPSTGSTIPPLYISSTYTQIAPGEHLGYEYARSNNPTREHLEASLAALEGGAACAAFASGLAACSTVLDTLLPGEGVLASHDMYGGTYRLLDKIYRPLGIEVAFAKDGSIAAYEEALQSLHRPRLIWIESPTNPLLDIVNIKQLADFAEGNQLLLVVDNTFASPYLQQPLELGADLVVHSTTKYLSGHSDVIGGAVIARTHESLEKIRFLQNARGAVPGPLDCYLVHRGIKTLALRMRQHCNNASLVARVLEDLPIVKKVYYPGLPHHPGHKLAQQQMNGFGGMVSFELLGGLEEAREFCMNLKVISLAESLGGVESLCCHPATMTHASIPREVRQVRGISDELIRLSVGLENVEDITNDIEQAMDVLTNISNTDAL